MIENFKVYTMLVMTTAFIEWIEHERDVRGWSIRELSRRSGLSSGTVSDVLSDRTNPGFEFCRGIARALGEPPEKVLRLAGLLPRRTSKNEQIDELLHYYDQLPPDLQAHFRTMVRALAESTTGGQEAEEDAQDRALDEAPATA